MTLQEQLEEMTVASMQSLSELREDEQAWLTLAAKHKCVQAEHEKVASIQVHEKLVKQTANMSRPSVMMRPELAYDGEWVASYSGVEARGITPELACQEFDRLWLGK